MQLIQKNNTAAKRRKVKLETGYAKVIVKMRQIKIAVFFSCAICLSAFAAESTENLIARMTDKNASWEERCIAEDKLTNMPFQEVLPALLPHIHRSCSMFPGGPTREFENISMPVECQISYAIHRSWGNQVKKLLNEQGGELLNELLQKAAYDHTKYLILNDMQYHWSPNAESTVANLLKNPKEDLSVRTAAGLVLSIHGKENYHELFLEYANSSNYSDRCRWYKVLVDPRHKSRSGIDPRVVVMGFGLIEEYTQSSPNYIQGAYFLTTDTGDYVGQEFKPDQRDPNYNDKHGLKEEFFQDMVKNALRWWNQNGDKIKKGLQQDAPADANKPKF